MEPSRARKRKETDHGDGRRRPRRLRHVRRAQRAGPRRCTLEPGAPAAPDGRRAHPAGPQRGAGRRRGRGASDDPALLAVARHVPGRRQPQVPHLLDGPVRAAAGSARDVRRRPRGQEHRRGTGGLPSGNGRLPRVRLRGEQARVRRRRHLHPRVRDARAAGLWRSRRAVLPRGRVAIRGLRRRLHPASRVRDHARPEQIDRGLARRRPHGVRDPRHLHPRTRSHRVRDLDDAADPGRSQSLARRAGHERAVAPVPCTRDRRDKGTDTRTTGQYLSRRPGQSGRLAGWRCTSAWSAART